MDYRRHNSLQTRFIEPLMIPAIIVGGLLLTIAGGYHTISQQHRCARIGANSGYEESYIVPGRRGVPDQCVCRGRRDANGHIDMTVSQSIPLD